MGTFAYRFQGTPIKSGGIKIYAKAGRRESMRQLDDLTVAVPFDDQQGFRDVHSDLVDMQSTLMNALFPAGSIRDKKPKPPAK